MMRIIKILPIIIVISFIALIISCGDDHSTDSQNQAPTIPPQSSFKINFDEFPDTSSTLGMDKQIASKINWGLASANVKFWNSVLTVTLAIPAAAFIEAFNHQPVQQKDDSWLWKYSISFNGETFTAKLIGMDYSYRVDWKMLLSKSGSYTDLEWFTGSSNSNATEGNWVVNKNPDLPSPFISIEWQRNVEEETANVKYTLVSPTIQYNGSYINYGKTNEVPLNRFYQIFNSENNNLTDIKWNHESKFGRVKDLLFFQNTNWHCWDENLDDANCTN